ncbi:MAG: SGNH/GDSL hydrolase family protein [Thermoanaerobaculia bacterium]
MTRYERYVAIGDSSTEGLVDPDGAGGYRGWANRLAEHVARQQGALLYANLGVRGRKVRQIRDRQLGPALAMKPDLVTLFGGTNDVVRPSFDAGSVAADIEHMQRALIEGGGATVLGFTLPDLAGVMPLGRLVAGRVEELNAELRRVSHATGAILVDFTAYPVASDPRLWNEDRLHANSLGHERIAAALAHALELEGFDGSWARPLPRVSRSRADRLAAEARWLRRYLLPWVWRHLHGRSSGDGRGPKRPDLRPVELG